MKFISLLLVLALSCTLTAQENQKEIIKKIFDNALTDQSAYQNLKYLCDHAPGRLIGTENSYVAVNYMKEYLETLELDTVFLQSFESPAWICESASAKIIFNKQEINLNVDALGPSISTDRYGLTASVIEVSSLDEIKALSEENVKGKIVFFNGRVNPTTINTFRAYGAAVGQRYSGPEEAAKKGALGVIVRSVNSKLDDFPHTGSCNQFNYRIPAMAVSTNDAELLSEKLKMEPNLQLQINIQAKDIEVTTFNLIADIRGSEKPDEYIVVSGHIDSWHNTQGAHDDGIGCMQAVDVLRLFKDLKLNNKRTIRVILFMDEELYQSGGNSYAEYTQQNNIKHYFALEADAGGLTPEGFTIDASEALVANIQSIKPLLLPYGIYYTKKGGGGVDIAPLKKFGVPLAGYRTDAQRYFEYHHSANDTFDKVNFREMQLGSGNMASLIYLIDQLDLMDE